MAVLLAGAPLQAQTISPPVSEADQAAADQAMDEGDFSPAATRLPVVVTARRVPQQPWETGQALTVVDRAEIEQRQTVAVADLLATTPGVTISRNGSLGGFTGVRLRGAEAEQTLVVIDGIRVNDPSSPGGGFDFANLLAASVERIEVLRGPNSMPWGSQAIGGVVNILTADPARLADRALTARAQAEYGHADQRYATAGLQGRRGIVSGSISGGYLRSDGISAAANGTERDGYRQHGASGRVGLAFTDAIALDLRGYWADSRAELDGFAPPSFALGDTREYSTAQELYGYAGLNARTGRVTHRAAFTIADVDRDIYDRAIGTAPNFIGRGRSERYEYQGDWRAIEAIRLIGGIERENSRFNDGSTFAQTGVTSLYGQLVTQPVRTLTLTGGARHDDHDTFGKRTTLGADGAWRRGRTTLRASYGEGFKAPTLFQLFSFFGNERLAPETASSFDIGVQQGTRGGRAAAGVTYFSRRTRNQIDFRSCTAAERATAGSICVGRPFGTYDNIARTRAEGVELELTLRPVDALTLFGQFSLIDATNRSAGANRGRDLARRPHETASVSADYRFPFGLSIGGTALIAGDSFDNVANSVRLDGYALLSVRAAVPIDDRLELYGRVENLGDERYQTAVGYGSFGRAAYAGLRVRLE